MGCNRMLSRYVLKSCCGMSSRVCGSEVKGQGPYSASAHSNTKILTGGKLFKSKFGAGKYAKDVLYEVMANWNLFL